MLIAFGSDHAGFEYRQILMDYARELGHEVLDFGTYTRERCDYPVFGRKVAEAIKTGAAERGILVCGTGFGISLSANRVKGIRCVNASDEYTVRLARQHNNVNMISIGQRVVGVEKAKALIDIFLNEKYEGGRHDRRLSMLDE